MLVNLLLVFILVMGRVRSDPDPLQDYCVSLPPLSHQRIYLNGELCKDPTLATVSDFMTSALSRQGNKNRVKPFMVNVTLTTTANLPGLNTMGLTMARLDFGASGVVPPHSHPRASEVTVCLDGVLLVGFVDTSGRVFTQELHPGETFVFPKGLIHFLYNIDTVSSALAVSGLSSQNPGTQLMSLVSFTLKLPIPEEILKRAYENNGHEFDRIHQSQTHGG